MAVVIASNVRRLRQARGFTQDGLATRLRELGLPWNRSAVAHLESARGEPNVTELLLLAVALNVPPAELLQSPKGTIAVLPDGRKIPAELLPELVRGRGYRQLVAERTRGRAPAFLVSVEKDGGWTLIATEAERRAASQLGLTVEQLQEASAYLWGRILDEERDERAGHPTGSGAHMKRAHATRKLMAELKAEGQDRGWLVDEEQEPPPRQRKRKESK